MEAIELLARLQANEKVLGEMEEKVIMIENEIAMIRKEIVDFCRTTEEYEVVVGSTIHNGIAQSVKDAKYVSLFSSSLFANPGFAELVRGKRYGLFRSDSDFALVVKFVGFDLSEHPEEYKKGRTVAEELARQKKIIATFDKDIFFENGLIHQNLKRS